MKLEKSNTMRNNNTIKKTIELNLCTSCEGCRAICPVGAISMIFNKGQFIPVIDNKICTECGLCKNICPGYNLDPFNLFIKNNISEIELAGSCLDSYITYTKDIKIRKNSASGGIITTLIIELIRDNIYDKAFTLQYDYFDKNNIPKLKPTNQISEVINSAKSKYIPVSIYPVIEEIKRNPFGKYIIVGTGCQFTAIKNILSKLNIKEENILFLGLFCDNTLNLNIYKYFKKKYIKENNKINILDFRTKECGGWPGNTKIELNDGQKIFIDRKERISIKQYYQLSRCLYCNDKLNRQADISFGDCYIPGEESKLGKSNIIIRTEKGRTIYDQYKNKFISQKVDVEKILASQKLKEKLINFKQAKYFSLKNKLSNFTYNSVLDKNIIRDLIKKEKYINFGRDNQYYKIRLFIKINKIKQRIKKILKIFKGGLLILGELLIKNKLNKKTIGVKNNIIILGGGTSNRGAEAMTLSVVSEMKKKYPKHNIYLLTRDKKTLDYKDTYNFAIMEISSIKSGILNKTENIKQQNEINNILKNTEYAFDVSGYALSSQRGFNRSLMCMHDILLMRKYLIKYYLLPQSFGPFKYKIYQKIILFPLMKILLKYPVKIYAREDKSYKAIMKFTKNNVEKSFDIVLRCNYEENIKKLFKEPDKLRFLKLSGNSVGIVPNIRVAERVNKNKYFSLYNQIINELIKRKYYIYLIGYSNEDDQINRKIKSNYKSENVTIIPNDFNTIEMEYVIKQLKFIIASRFHSVIHAYKNSIPAVVIGWANKYYELLKSYNQIEYYYDCRNGLNNDKILHLINNIIKKRDESEKKISNMTNNIKSKSIFSDLFNSEKMING